MTDLECPKCGRNVQVSKWHLNCYPTKQIVDKKKQEIVTVEQNNYANYSSKEHLHYFCNCGYDFCTDIKKGDVVDDSVEDDVI